MEQRNQERAFFAGLCTARHQSNCNTARVEKRSLTASGKRGFATGPVSSRWLTAAQADFLFTVEDGRITSWAHCAIEAIRAQEGIAVH